MNKEVNQRTCQDHDWVVFSTALREARLLLQCVECGAMGTVDESTTDEWAEASSAPSNPYRWQEAKRVTALEPSTSEPYVVRANDGPVCDCVRTGKVPQPLDYERFPAEICRSRAPISATGWRELIDLAAFVENSDLCSRFFPAFLAGLEKDAHFRHSKEVREITERIQHIDSKGLHFSSRLVAWVLRIFAGAAPNDKGLELKLHKGRFGVHLTSIEANYLFETLDNHFCDYRWTPEPSQKAPHVRVQFNLDEVYLDFSGGKRVKIHEDEAFNLRHLHCMAGKRHA